MLLNSVVKSIIESAVNMEVKWKTFISDDLEDEISLEDTGMKRSLATLENETGNDNNIYIYFFKFFVHLCTFFQYS